MFGTFHLNDVTGSRVNSIELQCLGKPEKINITILEVADWEREALPCTWQILIKTLRDCEFIVLVDHARLKRVRSEYGYVL